MTALLADSALFAHSEIALGGPSLAAAQSGEPGAQELQQQLYRIPMVRTGAGFASAGTRQTS